ncbi:hypothetical protein ES705_28894 [subsurface metagenome]
MEITFENLPKAVQALDTRLDKIEKILTQPSQEPNKMFTVQEVAEYLSLSVPSIYRYISQRLIPHQKIHKRCYFLKSQIDQWVQGHSRKTIKELQTEIGQ